jgi:hypothetical protein
MSTSKTKSPRSSKASKSTSKFVDAKQTFAEKAKSAVKSASKIIGYGEEKWLSAPDKKLKEILKKLHQDTYLQEQKDARDASGLAFVKASVEFHETKREGKAVKPEVAAAVAKGEPKDALPKWTKKSTVTRALYVKKIHDYTTKSIQEWQTLVARKNKPSSSALSKLIFVRDGHPIPFFNSPFFNDSLNGADEIISWDDFKVNVFYEYIGQVSENIAHVKTEINALVVLSRAFDELTTEAAASLAAAAKKSSKVAKLAASYEKKAAKKEAEAKAASTAEVAPIVPPSPLPVDTPVAEAPSVTAVVTAPSAVANTLEQVTYSSLAARLRSYSDFVVGEKFWELECWNFVDPVEKADRPNYANELVSKKDFIDKWLSGQTVEDLRAVLEQLEAEQKINVEADTLFLTRNISPSAEERKDDELKRDNFDDEDGGIVPASSFGALLAANTPRKRKANVSSSTTTLKVKNNLGGRKQFFDNVKNVDGIPKQIVNLYNALGKDGRIVLRKIVASASASVSQNRGSSLEVARTLFRNSEIQTVKTKANLQRAIDNAKAKANGSGSAALLSKIITTPSKATTESAMSAVKLEYTVLTLQDDADKFVADSEIIYNIVRDNYRRELKLARPNATDFTAATTVEAKDVAPISNAISATVFKKQLQALNKVAIPSRMLKAIESSVAADSVAATADALVTATSIDFSAELHDVIKTVGNSIFSVLSSILSWHAISNTGSVSPISIEYLKYLVESKTKEFLENVSILDLLNLVQKWGSVSQETFTEFTHRLDNGSVAALAQLNTIAVAGAIDGYVKRRNSAELIESLNMYGPSMATLPVRSVETSNTFWRYSAPQDGASSEALTSFRAQEYKSAITVEVVGYDKEKNMFRIRHHGSKGKAWGKMGSTWITPEELFDGSMVISIINNTASRFQFSPLTNKLAGFLALIDDSI